MASTSGNANFVQTTFTDNFTRGYPGQIASASGYISNEIETYPGQGDIFMGRGVVIGVEQPDQTTGSLPLVYSAPFSVRLPEAGDAVGSFVGIAIRPYVTTTNLTDEDGNQVAGYPDKGSVAVIPFNTHIKILVDILVGNEVATNNNVYMAVNPTNDAGVHVGEFATNASGTTGLVEVPSAKWWITKTATINDTIGVIRLHRTN